MHFSILKSFFDGKCSLNTFLGHIEDEIEQYVKAVKKNGSSLHILVDGVEEAEELNRKYLLFLLEHYLSGNLGEWDLEYLLNWIEMADFDLDNRTEEVVSLFSTSEINYPINHDNIREALFFLKGERLHPDYKGNYEEGLYQSLVCQN